ncbi:hypothetical protein PPL_06515 [Heterostelium album PN500]|uniref:Uncharacterized protein n=1 Tax=Heterostelium pallidum (strain ATCC 26659 / Pp 5 / PN500) TaxID=670386 RepID=D3BDD2_HETP5|nr:hypothetical protein PPL_06515 [Heterostelium album PN500]EFA80576.1 hypothetical protein PPL_06515 [Heterostelium album PN500]|eukprot:XP_020432696.1 hypothetical protein PPL_06515 [Heterostelium album PN500]
MTYHFNICIQEILFSCMFNDKLYSFQWRLSLNLVSKRWFDFMRCSIINTDRKVLCNIWSSDKLTDVLKPVRDIEGWVTHLLDREYCMLRHAKTVVVQINRRFELYYLQKCSRLTKVSFLFKSNNHIEPLLEFINSSQTLTSVQLIFDYTDSILCAILLNRNIRKLTIGKSTPQTLEKSLDNRLANNYIKKYQQQNEPNTTLVKLKFKDNQSDRTGSNNNEKYRIYNNPLQYIKGLVYLSLGTFLVHLSLGNSNQDCIASDSLSQIPASQCYPLEALLQESNYLSKLTIGSTIRYKPSDVKQIATLLESNSTIYTVDIMTVGDRPNSILSQIKKSEHFKQATTKPSRKLEFLQHNIFERNCDISASCDTDNNNQEVSTNEKHQKNKLQKAINLLLSKK